ncbi:MAG: Stk1 family PASTA domain-containing Ser/Thr kinase [Gaiellaceae bacterium]|jgi:serine/threonine-protein kinase
MTPPDPLIGALFDGRYKVLKRLGAGGMATVYLAEDQELGRRVAIKILNAKHAGDEQFVERFRREASSAAGLSHPNIVQIYDRGKAEGTYYIAMEVIEGRSLKELIIERGPSPLPVAINYGRQILAALRFAHRNRVVHRDIKPHNVLVDEEGRVKVTDFGIARAGTSEMTEVGSIIGTAQYLSPEQARGAPVDTRSDLYSVGVVLYELLTGEAPYSGDTPVEIAMKHLSAVPVPPSERRPEVPPELDAVVLRALAKNPSDRYQSAEEMDADLNAISKGMEISDTTTEAATTVLAGAGLSAPTMISRAPTRITPPVAIPPAPLSGYYDLEGPTRRRPVWPWLLSLVLIAAVAVAFWIVFRQLSGNAPVSVPPVMAIHDFLARKKIVDAGLKPQTTTQTSSTVPAGDVITQSPAAGVRVARGSTVRIWVSKGTADIRVISVVGMSAYTAGIDLTTLGFKVINKQVHSAYKVGDVFKQSPTGNTKAPRGSQVTIWVSLGVAQISVPDVRTLLYDTASSQLVARGFKVARQDVDSPEPVDTVIGENPLPNSLQDPGTTITLKVSKGPQLQAVPPVTNDYVSDAKSALTAAGFKPIVQYQDTTDPNQAGYVLDQSPLGGVQALPGSEVTIYVGNYVPTTTTT